jgi:hypothetical protein
MKDDEDIIPIKKEVEADLLERRDDSSRQGPASVVTTDSDIEPAARFFEAYFHQDCLLDDGDWEAVVQRFKDAESQETRRLTREALQRLLARMNDGQLDGFLFDGFRSFYDPRPAGMTARAWLEGIVHLLAGGVRDDSERNAVAVARREASAVARAILSGETDILLGARDLCALRFSVGAPEDDEDFTCFVVIESETDTLPLGPVRARWAPEALELKDVDIARARKWAQKYGWPALENIVRRFEGAG